MPLLRDARRAAVIIVNSVSSPSINWGLIQSAPGIFDQWWQASSVPIDQWSCESVDLLSDVVALRALERILAIAQALLNGASATKAELEQPSAEPYAIDVSVSAIPDPGERQHFENPATSFILPPVAIERLRDVAGRLMRAPPRYHELVESLGGDPR
jgi:NTE family protein